MVLISRRNRSAPIDGGEFGPQDLDGDLAVVLEVVGEIDRGHAAGAELALDAVAVGQGGRELGQRVGHAVSSSNGIGEGRWACRKLPHAARPRQLSGPQGRPFGNDRITLWLEGWSGVGPERQVLIIGAQGARGVADDGGEMAFLPEERWQAPEMGGKRFISRRRTAASAAG